MLLRVRSSGLRTVAMWKAANSTTTATYDGSREGATEFYWPLYSISCFRNPIGFLIGSALLDFEFEPQSTLQSADWVDGWIKLS